MGIRSQPWPPGVPCWVDLSTPDMGTARDFYSSVLGWSFIDPEDSLGGYVVATVRGHAVAAIGPLQGDMRLSAWTLYFASEHVDKTAAAITDAGGSLLRAPGDVGPMGRLLIGSDPSGGVFGVWQAGTHIGAALVNEPGAVTWEDLRSTDPDAARAFYGEVFGLESQSLPGAGPGYGTFHVAGDQAPLGGIGGMFGAPDGTPSHWLVYFNVSDADATASAVETHGGQVLGPPIDSPFGRMVPVVDPGGANFVAFQPSSEQPDPERWG